MTLRAKVFGLFTLLAAGPLLGIGLVADSGEVATLDRSKWPGRSEASGQGGAGRPERIGA